MKYILKMIWLIMTAIPYFLFLLARAAWDFDTRDLKWEARCFWNEFARQVWYAFRINIY
jgi:hypothetical protein